MVYKTLTTHRKEVILCGLAGGMKPMLCTRTDCFYCAKSQCVSLGVLSAETCDRYLHKQLSRKRTVPELSEMKALRVHIDTHAPLYEDRRSA